MKRNVLILAAIHTGLVLLATACHTRSDFYFDDGPIDDFCRENPRDCVGEIGGACDRTEDCYDGVCCTEKGNCDGGMCLYQCDRDADCPTNQRCEHDHCFFACDRDSDCGPGQSCEHGDTICEYD